MSFHFFKYNPLNLRSEQCILLLIHNGNPAVLNPKSKNAYNRQSAVGKFRIESMIDQVPEVEDLMGEEGRCLHWEDFHLAPSPRVIKSHAPPSLMIGTNLEGPKVLFAQAPRSKLLVVVRNPLDTCVSNYYHTKNSAAKRGIPFDAWAILWMNGYVAHGSWIQQWYSRYQQYPSSCSTFRI
jgi:hypothetical protein